MKQIIRFGIATVLLGGLLAGLPACKRKHTEGQPVNTATNTPAAGANSPDPGNPISEIKFFTGSIGSSNDLQMKLARKGMELSGSYSYLRIGKPITLNGTVDKEGNVELSEFDAGGAQTGVFKGTWNASDPDVVRIEGAWSKPNDPKQTKFSVIEQPIRLTGGLEWVGKRIKESDNKLMYDIEVVYPQLSGSTEARIGKFNSLIKGLVFKKISQFKKGLAAIAAEEEAPPSDADMRSELNIHYRVGLVNDDLVSTGFDIGGYSRGAAHPNSYSETVNYDLKNGKVLKLADLFQPAANYLKTISAYAIEDLKKQSKSEGSLSVLTDSGIQSGAAAKPANYKSWTITGKGLALEFDAYQVGRYAAGPQHVTVPYAALKDIINPDGPLGRFVQ